jgi:hypothetical protein
MSDSKSLEGASSPLPQGRSRAEMTDQERMARGRAQIAAGNYIEDDQVDAFLDSLTPNENGAPVLRPR